MTQKPLKYSQPSDSSNNKPTTIPTIHGLIVAAGKGSRFNAQTPKQYVQVKGKTILEHTVHALANSSHINHLFLVVASDDEVAQSLNFALPVTFVHGGVERWQSVSNGVDAIIASGANPQDLVVIHDAARPCVRTEHIDKVIEVATCETFGAILGVPIVDTIKKVSRQAQPVKRAKELTKLTIQSTVDRNGLWKAQTPQVFRLGKLRDVLDNVAKNDLMITDEASAFELNGYPIRMVEGCHQNIKLTYKEDLALIEMIMARQVAF